MLKKLLTGLFLLPLSLVSGLAETKIVTTIKPLHSLVAAVSEGVSEPALLLPGDVSPHGTTLKPSQARLLTEADIVFWVGPELETFLEKALPSIAPDATSVALMEQAEVSSLPFREFGDEHHNDDSEHDHGHDHASKDPHVWLDPVRTSAMVDVIAATLALHDPENSTAYTVNAERTKGRLAMLNDEIATKLAPLKDRGFVVFHDGYQYFEQRFGLMASSALAIEPDHPPGARRVQEIRSMIEEQNIACMFSEPQFPAKLTRSIANETGTTIVELDPIGFAIKPGPALYETLIRTMADQFVKCLGASE